MRHGLDSRSQSSGEPPILSRLPTQSGSLMQPQGGLLMEDDISRGNLNSRPSGFVPEVDALKPDKQSAHLKLFSPSTPGSTTPSALPSQTSQVKVEEVCLDISQAYLRINISLTIFPIVESTLTCLVLLVCRHVLVMICLNKILRLQVCYQVWDVAKSCVHIALQARLTFLSQCMKTSKDISSLCINLLFSYYQSHIFPFDHKKFFNVSRLSSVFSWVMFFTFQFATIEKLHGWFLSFPYFWFCLLFRCF